MWQKENILRQDAKVFLSVLINFAPLRDTTKSTLNYRLENPEI
jgi:hypothetical protein